MILTTSNFVEGAGDDGGAEVRMSMGLGKVWGLYM